MVTSVEHARKIKRANIGICLSLNLKKHLRFFSYIDISIVARTWTCNIINSVFTLRWILNKEWCIWMVEKIQSLFYSVDASSDRLEQFHWFSLGAAFLIALHSSKIVFRADYNTRYSMPTSDGSRYCVPIGNISSFKWRSHCEEIVFPLHYASDNMVS